MSGTSLRAGLPLPVLTPIRASAIPLGRSDALERNVARILGLDEETPVGAPAVEAIPAPAATPTDGRRGQHKVFAAVAGVAVVAGGMLFLSSGPQRAPSPPPIATARPLPRAVAKVRPRPAPASIAPRALLVADATPLTHSRKRDLEDAPPPRRPSHVASAAVVGQAFTAIALPDIPASKPAPEEASAPVTRLADRSTTGSAAPIDTGAATPATPPADPSALKEETRATPPRARTEAIEAIRMLRRQ